MWLVGTWGQVHLEWNLSWVQSPPSTALQASRGTPDYGLWASGGFWASSDDRWKQKVAVSSISSFRHLWPHTDPPFQTQRQLVRRTGERKKRPSYQNTKKNGEIRCTKMKRTEELRCGFWWKSNASMSSLSQAGLISALSGSTVRKMSPSVSSATLPLNLIWGHWRETSLVLQQLQSNILDSKVRGTHKDLSSGSDGLFHMLV